MTSFPSRHDEMHRRQELGLPESKLGLPGSGTISLHKIGFIVGLALATMLPNYFVSALIAERELRQVGVEKEFVQNWGPVQELFNPVLVVPYQTTSGRPRQYLKVAPARLDVAVNLAPQERRRGVFHATVYDAKVEMQGAFLVPAEARLKEAMTDKDGRLLWEDSFLAFGTTSSLAGLRAEDRMLINGAEAPLQPCREAVRPEQDCKGAAIVVAAARLDAGAAGSKVSFRSAVSLRGTSAFTVNWTSKELDATIRSPWQTPSFGGDVLPVTSSVTPQGFEAHWQAIEFGSPRVAASSTIIDAVTWNGSKLGVDLIEATPIYRMINRMAKYGLLVVVLAFATYFFFEVLSRLQIHIVQYGLLGLSLSLFSLLLLSLSEPIGYTAGYATSAGLVLAQSALYTAAVARRAAPALAFAGVLATLFVFLYVLLGLETYSLLVGTIALFLVVSALMILTHKVNWWADAATG